MPKTSSPRIPPHIVALMMLQALEHNTTDHEGVHDPEVQDAIDWMADALHADRPRLMEFLRRQFVERPAPGRTSYVTEAILEAWTDGRKLKKATGRSRDEWLNLIG